MAVAVAAVRLRSAKLQLFQSNNNHHASTVQLGCRPLSSMGGGNLLLPLFACASLSPANLLRLAINVLHYAEHNLFSCFIKSLNLGQPLHLSSLNKKDPHNIVNDNSFQHFDFYSVSASFTNEKKFFSGLN